MEDKTLRKGLSVTAIILVAVMALVMCLNNVNGIAFGDETKYYGIPFIAAFAIPLLGLLIILTRYCKSTDTVSDMIAAIGVRYAIFGWCFIFVMRVMGYIMKLFFHDFYMQNYSTIYLIMNSFNVCVVCTLVLALVLRGLPTVKIEKKTIKFGQLLVLILMVYGLAQVGSLMGMPIHSVLTLPTTLKEQESLGQLQDLLFTKNPVIRIITVGILPAIFEELLFRKFLIDRTLRHGEFISCAMSGIMFGLWHGNFQQFFFTFFIGVLFGFVYIRTGRIIYTMILHGSLNLVTSSITTELLAELIKRTGFNFETGQVEELADYTEAMNSLLPVLLLMVVWLLIITGIQVAGFILLIVKRKKFKLVAREGEMPRKQLLRTLTHSPEMWIFFSMALLLFVNSYIPDIISLFI